MVCHNHHTSITSKEFVLMLKLFNNDVGQLYNILVKCSGLCRYPNSIEKEGFSCLKHDYNNEIIIIN